MATHAHMMTIFLALTIGCGSAQEPASGSAPAAAAAQRDASTSVARIPNAETTPQSAPAPTSPPEKDVPPTPANGESLESAAAAECIQESKPSRCLPLFGRTLDDLDSAETQRGRACTSGCIGARDGRLKRVLVEAGERCKEAYVKGGGKHSVACKFPKVAKPKDPRELSMRFQDALRAAVEKRDEASARALDELMPRLDAEYLAAAEPECTQKCRDEGAEAVSRAKPPPTAPKAGVIP